MRVKNTPEISRYSIRIDGVLPPKLTVSRYTYSTMSSAGLLTFE